MPIEPGKGAKDPGEDSNEQVNQQKLNADSTNKKKTRNDIRIAQLLNAVRTTIDRALGLKSYLQKLKEKQSTTRLGRFRRRIAAFLEELLASKDAPVTPMLPKTTEAETKPLVPPIEKKQEEAPKKPLLFSFFRKAISTKPKPDGSNKRKKRPKI